MTVNDCVHAALICIDGFVTWFENQRLVVALVVTLEMTAPAAEPSWPFFPIDSQSAWQASRPLQSRCPCNVLKEWTADGLQTLSNESCASTSACGLMRGTQVRLGAERGSGRQGVSWQVLARTTLLLQLQVLEQMFDAESQNVATSPRTKQIRQLHHRLLEQSTGKFANLFRRR